MAPKDIENKSDRTLLVETSTDVKWIKMLLQGHLKEHLQIRIMIYTSLLAAAGSLLLVLLK